MNVVLLGPPGSGKGTQAQRMVERLKIPSISTGEILREAIKNKTEMGLKAQAYMNDGKLVPDEVVIGIIRDRLSQDDCENGCILDGFPRTVAQAEALSQILDEKDEKLDVVVNLVVDQSEIVERLTQRQREDDKIETIYERLKVYEGQTAPLVSYYKGKGILKNIPGVGDMSDIFDRIVKAIPES